MPVGEHGWNIGQIEKDREAVARTYVCPQCDSRVGRRCTDGDRAITVSHTPRYELGVADGLVPALGSRRG